MQAARLSLFIYEIFEIYKLPQSAMTGQEFSSLPFHIDFKCYVYYLIISFSAEVAENLTIPKNGSIIGQNMRIRNIIYYKS